MEPETPKPEGSQGFASFLHDLLASHVQEDGMQHRNWYHVTHLRDGDQYEAGGIQLVRRILNGGRCMPHIQMHVGNAKGLRGNVVRLIHEPHSHIRRVLPVEHTSSRGQNQGLFRCHTRGNLHQIGTFRLREPFQKAFQRYSAEHQLRQGLGEA